MPYYLRDIPSDLWEKVKIKANADGISVRSLIILLLRIYVEGKIPPLYQFREMTSGRV